MKGLEDETIVALWERGRRISSEGRARLLAAMAQPDLGDEAVGKLTVGQRDSFLLTLREVTYGPLAVCFVECPACHEGLQSTIRLDDIRMSPDDPATGSCLYEEPPWKVVFRLPTVDDIEWAAGIEPTAARCGLWSRLVLEAYRAGDSIDAAALPKAIVASIEERIEHLDPQASVRFGQTCPVCAHRFETTFDIASYLWQELDVDARRLLQEVDAIARAYGWSESEIFRLGRARRRTYLELCGSR